MHIRSLTNGGIPAKTSLTKARIGPKRRSIDKLYICAVYIEVFIYYFAYAYATYTHINRSTTSKLLHHLRIDLIREVGEHVCVSFLLKISDGLQPVPGMCNLCLRCLVGGLYLENLVEILDGLFVVLEQLAGLERRGGGSRGEG